MARSVPQTRKAEAFDSALTAVAAQTDAMLAHLLEPCADDVPRLWDAMRYAALAGGKRLRPFLVLAASDICGGERNSALRVAAAIEMMHTYSLVHDDLPAMDDDDMRRGQPSLHREFDEATAILAGDALLTLAFEVLSDPATHRDATVRAELVLGLARAGGPRGMAGGQMLDLEAETDETSDRETVYRLESMKTGALFAWACEAGAVVADADPDARERLRSFGVEYGMAFQITDDILDEVGDAEEVGKAVGKDSGRGKATLVSLAGLEAARSAAIDHARRGSEFLDIFGEKADLLRAAADRLIDRRV
ncbi:MAG: polyprenyl synthetase family protein [Alphaproteobacteria bacterium]|nr:polyprenyl synthetase family protein [Alphaproteobacteria bacterium]